jgi:HD-like signal output (HDOD) protein
MEATFAKLESRPNFSRKVNRDEVINAAKSFEPLSPTIVKLSSMLVDKTIDLNEIISLISYDQALTCQLLKAANSAYVGSASRITNVQEAAYFMGKIKTLNLLLACAFGSELRNTKLPAYEEVEGQLWRDSVIASITAEQCSKVFRLRIPPETACAALLLNAGKVILSRFISDEMKRYISVSRLSGRNQIQAELEVLDTHYVEVGGIIAEHWGLPPEITIGVKYQHDPDKVKKATSDVTHICYRWIEFISAPVSSGSREIKINPNVIQRLQPSSKAWFKVMQALVKERYQKICGAYGLREKGLLPKQWACGETRKDSMNGPACA